MSRSKNSAYDTKDPMPSGPVGAPRDDDFVNEGFNKWQQARDEWKSASGKYAVNPSATQRGYNPTYQQQLRRRPSGGTGAPSFVAVSTDEVIERLFSGNSNTTLPEAMPLGQMIQILVDMWDTEGLYD